jgi:hypothetical protein
MKEVTLRRELMPGGVKDPTTTPADRGLAQHCCADHVAASLDTTFLNRPLNKITVRCTEEHELEQITRTFELLAQRPESSSV